MEDQTVQFLAAAEEHVHDQHMLTGTMKVVVFDAAEEEVGAGMLACPQCIEDRSWNWMQGKARYYTYVYDPLATTCMVAPVRDVGALHSLHTFRLRFADGRGDQQPSVVGSWVSMLLREAGCMSGVRAICRAELPVQCTIEVAAAESLSLVNLECFGDVGLLWDCTQGVVLAEVS